TPPTVAQAPPAAALPTSPAPTPVATAPAPTQPIRAPSVSMTCQGSPDDCGVIRTEIARALQENQMTADVEIAVKVALVSERPSTQFGAPSTIRTYSVDLSGTLRGAALTMPPPRVFGFDALFGRRTLEQNARQLASATIDAVQAKGKN